jgi:hypothetical protein
MQAMVLLEKTHKQALENAQMRVVCLRSMSRMRGAADDDRDHDEGAIFHNYHGPDTSADPGADARQTVP